MARKFLVAVAWTAGVLIGLCILLYVVALAINLRDAEPSAAAQRLAAFHLQRPAVQDNGNAYVFVMGFDVGSDEDPMAMGLRRVEWLRDAENDTFPDLGMDPLAEPADHGVNRDPAIREYLAACGPRGTGCDDTLEAAAKVLATDQASEAWLFARYRALLKLEGWRELVPDATVAAIPRYSTVLDGQKLLLLHARVLAGKRDSAGVEELLGEDLRFWRRVLESSDLLISKMIATAAILRHFKVGATILGSLSPADVAAALPDEWQSAITDSERSMERCVAGEWQFMNSVIHDAASSRSATDFVSDDSVARIFWWLTEPLFQPQDTINRVAEPYSRVATLLDGVPLTAYEKATDHLAELSRRDAGESLPPRSIYNLLGQLIIGAGLGSADFGAYARRVSDLEGVRRAALLVVRLHEAMIPTDQIPAALAASPLQNPYDDEPFGWDPVDGTIVFRGLEEGERGEHRIH